MSESDTGVIFIVARFEIITKRRCFSEPGLVNTDQDNRMSLFRAIDLFISDNYH